MRETKKGGSRVAQKTEQRKPTDIKSAYEVYKSVGPGERKSGGG